MPSSGLDQRATGAIGKGLRPVDVFYMREDVVELV
jgi:hypothetical protein